MRLVQIQPNGRKWVALVCGLFFLAGCNLLETYEPVAPDVSSDAPTDVRRDGSGDARGGDADTAADVVRDSDVSSPPICSGRASGTKCPNSSRTYTVRQAVVSPKIDGSCSSEEFNHAAELPIPDPDATNADSENSSDNQVSCKMVWINGTPDQVQVCCEVRDSTRQNATPRNAPVEAIYGGTPTSVEDDRMEFSRRPTLSTSRDLCAVKTFVNTRPGRPVRFTKRLYPRDRTRVFNTVFRGRVKDTDNPNGYIAEWREAAGFELPEESVGLCNFAVMDPDTDGRALAFGTGYAINKPSKWGCCKYAGSK